jgi:uncharacterized protein YciI
MIKKKARIYSGFFFVLEFRLFVINYHLPIFVQMKTILLIWMMSLWAFSGPLFAQEKGMPDMSKMGKYTFVMLTTGPDRNQDSLTAATIQRGHLQHLDSLDKIGVLDIAGPFLDKSDWRGILIFNISDTVRVKQLVESDPAIRSGRLSYRMHPWMAQKGSTLR